MSEIAIEPYTKSLSAECVALELECPQGKKFRLRFERDRFHARAEAYDDWHILVAREGGRLVGTAAWAMKEVVLRGDVHRAAFLFDMRVHPRVRRRGIAHQLAGEIRRHCRAGGAAFEYGYCVADNAPVVQLAELFDFRVVGNYQYLVWPVYRERDVESEPSEASPADVHQAQCEQNGPFDFYIDPRQHGRLIGHVASYMGERAGCSLWSNAGILQEVVEAIPWHYRFVRGVLGLWPLSRVRWPRIPVPGEALQSWCVFDLFAESADDARQLMRFINNRALASGIDFCHVVLPAGAPWLAALRSEVPKPFSAVIPYHLLMGGSGDSPSPVERPYVDIRDL